MPNLASQACLSGSVLCRNRSRGHETACENQEERISSHGASLLRYRRIKSALRFPERLYCLKTGDWLSRYTEGSEGWYETVREVCRPCRDHCRYAPLAGCLRHERKQNLLQDHR